MTTKSYALYFDDDGEELQPGDWVTVNHETRAMIGETDGERRLVGFPNGEIVQCLQRVNDVDDENLDFMRNLF